MLVSLAISECINALYKLSQVSEEVAEKAESVGAAFAQSQSDLDDYKKKVEELYSVINDSSSSITDVTDARRNLLTIQDEMIEKFGTEESVIKNVTDAINGQTNAWERLTRAQWQEKLNEFNEEDGFNNFSNFINGYSDNIDRMLDEYDGYEIKIGLGNISGHELREQAAEILSEYGEIEYEMGSVGTIGPGFLRLSGNATEVHEKLVQIQADFNELEDVDFGRSFNSMLTKYANDTQEISAKYKQMHDAYVLNDEIFKDDDYSSFYDKLTEGYEIYNDAVVSGEKDKITAATQEFSNLFTQAIDNATENGDERVASFFRDMFPTMESVMKEWDFKVNILPEIDTKQLEGKTKSDVLKMLTESGVDEGKTLFNDILQKADEFGVVVGTGSEQIDQLLDLLVDWKIIQADIAETANNIKEPDLTISDSVKQITEQLKTQFTELGEAYKEIFTADGFTLENVDNDMLESIRSSFSELEEDLNVDFDTSELNNFFSVLTNGSSSADQVQQAFNSLAGSYLYSTEVLKNLNDETAQSVIKQLEEMGVVNANEVVTAALSQRKEELALENLFLAETGKQLSNATVQEIYDFMNEQVALGNLSQSMAAALMQKILFASTSMNTTVDVNSILTLAKSAGVATESISALSSAMQLYNNALASGNSDYLSMAQSELERVSSEIFNNINNFEPVDFKATGGSAGSAGKEAADEYLEAFEKELAKLDDLKERGKITEKEYLDALRVK